MESAIGMTTSIPMEIALAAGLAPLDLNNLFITHDDPAALVSLAEDMGLARTLCAWIKGLYAWCMTHPEMETIIAVTQGDCSNTHALMELFTQAGRRVIPFDYPHNRSPQEMQTALHRLAAELGADLDRAEEIRRSLVPLRRLLMRLDELTWQSGRVTGHENHLWQVSASDFNGDAAQFQAELEEFLEQAASRPARQGRVRLGFLGVPPIMEGLHQAAEEQGALVVFNEVQRQFAMPWGQDGPPKDLAAQYLAYTYPYDIFWRLEDIKRQIALRKLDGLIHYTQSFCFRGMQDIIIRQETGLPVLTVEGDRTGPADPRTLMRLEAFIDLIR